jgi:hypothetical protein
LSWQFTRSRGLAMAGAIVFSLALVFNLYLLTDMVRGDDAWSIASRVGKILGYGALTAVYWTNWRKLRPAE